MLYTIQIQDEPIEIEANDNTNALIALSHFIRHYPTKNITLTYNGGSHASPTSPKP